MKTRLRCGALLFFLGLLLVPSPSSAEIYIERFGNGKIDWSNGVVEAVGVAAPPLEAASAAQARAVAVQQATSLARKNMLEILRTLRIDSKHLAKDMVLKNGSFDQTVKDLLYHSEELETSFLPDSRVSTSVTVCIRGSLSDLLLPASVREIQHIKGGLPKKTTASPDPADEKPFTGLVIDCRGLNVKPALVPRILDEDGNEVYGPATVNRKYALKQGVAGYVKKLGDALRDPRIGGNPLRVKAVRSSGPNSSDIVISNSDAGKIIGSPENLSFLEEAEVIIVLE